MSSTPTTANRFRLTLICISIIANSLTAGGVFMFPILSPTFVSVLKLTQPQLTTVAVAGMIGQYPFSPVVGKILDRYGPSACSLIGGMLFFFAFLSTAIEIARAPVNMIQSSMSSFYRLTIYFLMIGLGTVFSYFSSVFAASKTFPRHPGLASGSSMALFGLSPLFLSTIASIFFTQTASSLLQVVPFLIFLALITITAHILGLFTFRSSTTNWVASSTDEEDTENTNENSVLLPHKVPNGRHDQGFPNPTGDPYFWLLAVYCLLAIGACEMVISNLAAIAVSLPPQKLATYSGYIVTDTVSSTQVKILSFFNTASRLVVGPLADFLSPVTSRSRPDRTTYSRKHRLSRVAFLSGAAFLLVVAFLFMETLITSREMVWVLSVFTGTSYGIIFTVLPGIISSIWGQRDLGRNFGIITCAPFIGTPLFSYLYAYVSVANSQDTNICEGTSCWQTTFWVSCGTSILACGISIILWRQWRQHQ